MAKLGDFGLSRMLKDFRSSDVPGQTPDNPRWAAPEVINGRRYRSASDVFSFGVVMWEVLSCEVPWRGSNSFLIMKSVPEGQRLPVPSPDDTPGPPAPASLRAMYVDLMKQCWTQDPTERPKFAAVVQELERMKEMTI